MRHLLKAIEMKHFFTLGIIVLTGQLGFAGAYAPVDAGVCCHGFCKDDGNPRPSFLR
jgi:hypothetical protein